MMIISELSDRLTPIDVPTRPTGETIMVVDYKMTNADLLAAITEISDTILDFGNREKETKSLLKDHLNTLIVIQSKRANSAEIVQPVRTDG